VFGLLNRGTIFLFAVAKDRGFWALVIKSSLVGARSLLSVGSELRGVASTPPRAVLRCAAQATSSPRRASDKRALCKGSYTSPVIQSLCKSTESLRATATTARFLAFLPPRPAIFSP
jgi:hypothetical protein